MTQASKPTPALPALALVNIRRKSIALTHLLESSANPDITWSAPSGDLSEGLAGELDGHTSTVKLDRTSMNLEESCTSDTPAAPRNLVRSTYARYLNACLAIGSFAFESVPIRNSTGHVEHDSLRSGVQQRGAEWLADLPTSPRRSHFAPPARSELTVIEGPPPESPSEMDTGDKSSS